MSFKTDSAPVGHYGMSQKERRNVQLRWGFSGHKIKAPGGVMPAMYHELYELPAYYPSLGSILSSSVLS